MTFNIALLHNLFANIKSSYKQKHEFATIKYHKGTLDLLYILRLENFINFYEVDSEFKKIFIYLRYSKNGRPLFFSLKMYLQAGRNLSFNYKELLVFYKTHPLSVLTTRKGILFISEAIKLNVGGILIFEIKAK